LRWEVEAGNSMLRDLNSGHLETKTSRRENYIIFAMDS